MDKQAKILITGGAGMVGQALRRRLKALGFANVLAPARAELDLADQAATARFFALEKPEYAFLAASRVGGILANRDYPADYIAENLRIYCNCIDSAVASGARKLLFIGSSCVYPNCAPQPISEEALLTGPFEPALEFFGAAKLAGIKLCQAYRRQHGFDAICVMPSSLYGPGDYFDLERAHALPALLRKFHEARQAGASAVEIWGSGEPRREFLHVDDFAEAAILLMREYSEEKVINVGSGEDIPIVELARLIQSVVGFEGKIELDGSRPNGVHQKLLDITRVSALGWAPAIPLRAGIESTYRWMLENPEIMRS